MTRLGPPFWPRKKSYVGPFLCPFPGNEAHNFFFFLGPLFLGLRQESGEGVVRRNGCPKRVFWRVRFFSSHLRFSGVFSANLTGTEEKQTLQKHPLRRPFPRTTPSPLLWCALKGVGCSICVTVRLLVCHCGEAMCWQADAKYPPFRYPPSNLPENHCRGGFTTGDENNYILYSEKIKSVKKRGDITEINSHKARREKNCNCNRNIRSCQGRTGAIITLQ